LLFFVVVFVVV